MEINYTIFRDWITKFEIGLQNYINNYEMIKLDIVNPNYSNFLLIFLFLVFIALTTRRININLEKNELLSVLHTDQLRGIAIFFVVLGHLWVHVSKTKPHIILSGDSVSLFLFLSGFGLAISTRNNPIGFKNFCFKRIKRVMIPYWIVTILILILDLLILGRILKLDSLLMTIFGINTRLELTKLDYVRWFVTFILLWYLVFYVFLLKYRTKFSSLLLLVIAFVLLPLNYYFFHFGWYQFFSFPIGCLMAIHYEIAADIFNKYSRKLIILGIIGVCYVLFYKILMSYENFSSVITKSIPNLLLSYYSDWNSLILVLSCIILTNKFIEKGFYSKFLLFLGKYSYEIFLLHGVFLIKYNPIIRDKNTLLLSFQFLMLLLFVIAISVLTYKTNRLFYEKKAV